MPILEMTLLDDDLYQDRHSPSGRQPKFDSVHCTDCFVVDCYHFSLSCQYKVV